MRYRGKKNEVDTWWLLLPLPCARHISPVLLPLSYAANGLLHNLKEALLDNVDIYEDCSEFNTRCRIEIEIVYLPLCS